MSSSPRPYRACSCRDSETKRLLGKGCPLLADSGHGKWYARYDRGATPDGARRQPRIGPFGTEAECQEALHERLYGGPTVNEILDDYLASLTCSTRTQDNYRRSLRTVRDLIGQYRSQYVERSDIDFMVNYMRERGKRDGSGGLSKRTIDMAVCQLRAAYELAIFRKRIKRRTIPVGPDPKVVTL
ncbi:hypothetical protein ACWEP4_26820 [Streptomyces sp. NPDC004227]